MEETSSIIKQATKRSLVIMDELGRGTSTFDGYSIAHAVLKYLTKQIRCLTLFSTHYHMLLDDFRHKKNMDLYHMAFKQNDPNRNDSITFLYKFVKGECPHSFGLNVARMAGLPQSVLKVAASRAASFREAMSHADCTRRGIIGQSHSSNDSTPAKELAATLNELQ